MIIKIKKFLIKILYNKYLIFQNFNIIINNIIIWPNFYAK